MSDPFKQLTPQRGGTGLIWVGLYLGLGLLAARLIYPVYGFSNTAIMEVFGNALFGWLVGLVAVAVVWTSLSYQSLIQRLLFLIFGYVAISCAWALGLMAQLDTERVVLSQREEVALLGLYPVLLLAHGLPPIFMRKFFGRVLAPMTEPHPVRPKMTTAWLMSVTAVVAICAAGFQFFATRVDAPISDLIPDVGIMAGICFTVGLLIVVPSVLLLFSRRRNFVLCSLVLLTFSGLIPVAFFLVIGMIFGRKASVDDYLLGLQYSGFAMTSAIAGAACIRSTGVRLFKELPDQGRA